MRLSEWSERFIPDVLRERGEDEVLRAKLWMVVASISTLTGVLTGLDHFVRGPRPWGIALLLATIPAIGCFSLLRRTGALAVVGNMTAALWFMALTGAIYVRGGAIAPGMLVLGLVPMVAILCAGWRSGLAWLVISICTLAIFVFAYEAGFEIPVRIPEEGRHFSDMSIAFVLTFTLTGVAFGYEWYRIATSKAKAKAQEERRDALERNRMAQADRLASLGQLSAGVAHEINNPLFYILSNIEFALDILSESPNTPDSEDLMEALSESAKGCQRVKQIVADLNTYSRNSAERLEPVNLVEIIGAAVKIADNQIRHHAQVLLPEAQDAYVLGDAKQLTQVFLNLLVNAAQSIPLGRANENCISVKIDVLGEWVSATVIDTGSGIPERDLERITEPFFTTKEVGEGTGLGLSVCSNIVGRYGGELSFASRVGHGTQATLRLPITEAPAVASPDPSTVRADEKMLRILVVDDDDMVRRSLRRTLAAHSVDLAQDGEQALRILGQGTSYDVVLCDIMMPDITGLDVHQALADSNAELAQRVVFLSGGVFATNLQERLDASPVPIIRKPVNRDLLLEAIVTAASQRRQQTGVPEHGELQPLAHSTATTF